VPAANSTARSDSLIMSAADRRSAFRVMLFGTEQIGHVTSPAVSGFERWKAFLGFGHGRSPRIQFFFAASIAQACRTAGDSSNPLEPVRGGTAHRGFSLGNRCLIAPPLKRFQRKPIDISHSRHAIRKRPDRLERSVSVTSGR